MYRAELEHAARRRRRYGDEGGISNIKTVYYYTLPHNTKHRQFTASNVFGPMNAVKALQRQMASEGKPWRTVTIGYTAGTTSTHVDTKKNPAKEHRCDPHFFS